MSLCLDNIQLDRVDAQLWNNNFHDLDAGEIVWLHGSNGVGKSTFLRCMAGLLPVKGTLVLRSGISVFDNKWPHVVAYSGVFNPLVLAYIVGEYLSLLCSMLCIDQSRRTYEINRVASLLMLEPIMSCHALSHGQLKRLSLATLWLCDRPLWLLDEPLVYVDDGWVSRICERIEELAAKGSIVYVVSHVQSSSLSARVSRHYHLERV